MSDLVVGTYNIKFTIDKPERGVRRLIRETDVSVIGLQEIGSQAKKDQLNAIPGWSIESWTDIPGDPQGADGLSNPIMWRNDTWSKTNEGYRQIHGARYWGNDGGVTRSTDPKYVGWVELTHQTTGYSFPFACLHLPPSITRVKARGDFVRQAILDELVPFVNNRSEKLVLVGDFNATPKHRVINPLYTQTGGDFTDVFTAKNDKRGTLGNRAIDLIFFHKDRYKVKYLKVLPNDYPSDHRPVVAYLRDKDDPGEVEVPPTPGDGGSGSPGGGAPPPTTDEPDDDNDSSDGGTTSDSRFYVNSYKQVAVGDRPIRYNPPLHMINRPPRVDFASSVSRSGDPGEAANERKAFEEWYDETDGQKKLRSLRLGRIVQSENAIGTGHTASNSSLAGGKYRWGFRFLYNPEKLVTNTVQYNQMLLNSGDEASMLLSGVGQNFQTHSISLLLNRIPDLLEDFSKPGASERAYGAPLLSTGSLLEAVSRIQSMGTMWDLEFLFRISNGVWDTRDLGVSGNIGFIQPNPCYLILGPGIKHYGFVESVTYSHQRFTSDMVPTLTQVDLTFRRSIYVTSETWEERLIHDPYAGEPQLASSEDNGGGSGSPDPDVSVPPSNPNATTPDPSGSNGRVTKATAHMWTELTERWGDVINNSHCWRADGIKGTSHPDGHACDFGTGTGQAPATGDLKRKFDEIAAWVVDNHEALLVAYVIWDRQIWSVRRKSEGWRYYNGSDGTANNDHTNHIHVATSEDGDR